MWFKYMREGHLAGVTSVGQGVHWRCNQLQRIPGDPARTSFLMRSAAASSSASSNSSRGGAGPAGAPAALAPFFLSDLGGGSSRGGGGRGGGGGGGGGVRGRSGASVCAVLVRHSSEYGSTVRCNGLPTVV